MTLVNGKRRDVISVHDRGFQFGDGIFETVAVQDGELLCWKEHFERLETGCRRLSIQCPAQDLLKNEARRLCQPVDLAVLKIIVTRGTGGRGYRPGKHVSGNRVLAIHDWPGYPPEYSRNGIHSCICHRRIARSPELAGIKHLNRLEQVLLRQEIAATPYPEGVALDLFDNVVEGAMSNLFIIKNGILITPDLSLCGVEGVIRRLIIAMNRAAGNETVIREIKLEELLAADEIFYCNSLIGIWPVTRIGNKTFDSSKLTMEIMKKLAEDNRIVASSGRGLSKPLKSRHGWHG